MGEILKDVGDRFWGGGGSKFGDLLEGRLPMGGVPVGGQVMKGQVVRGTKVGN